MKAEKKGIRDARVGKRAHPHSLCLSPFLSLPPTNPTSLLQVRVAHLTKIQDDGEKLKALAMDSDIAKRKIEIYNKIIKGETNSAKLSERPKMKPNPPTVNFRMSGTVMLHPINVRKALSKP
jgi:hypothetical protein